MKGQGIISITVDHAGGCDIRFEGESKFLLPLMGSLNLAGDFLKNKLMSKNSVGENWKQQKTTGDKTQNMYPENNVSKKEATKILLEHREKIEERLQAIVKCDDDAIFNIDQSLLSEI